MSDKHDPRLEVKYSESGNLIESVDQDVIDNFATFKNTAEKMIGRKLNFTTGGGSINHLSWNKYLDKAKSYYGVTQQEVGKGSKKSKSGTKINQSLINKAAKMMSNADQRKYSRGAVDIGFKGNNLTDSEILKLGKLSLEHGLRTIEEDDHLHLDSRHNVETKKDLVDYESHSDRPGVTEEMSANSQARSRALKQYLKDKEQSNTEFNEEAIQAVAEDEDRQLKKQHDFNKEAMQSPLYNMEKAGVIEEKEHKEMESIQKMSLAKKADFGLYN